LPYMPSSALTATNPAASSFAIVRATNVTGNVVLGGAQSGGPGAEASYLVVVVE
jgi:hypothetical protein